MIRIVKRAFWREIKCDWSCGKSTSKTQLWPWDKSPKVRERSVLKLALGVREKQGAAMASNRVVCGSDAAVVGRGLVSFFWMLGDSVRLRTTSTQWNVPGGYGAAWRALLLSFGKGATGPQGAESAGGSASGRMASFSSF